MTVKISRVMLTIAAVTALTALVPAAASAGKQAKRDVLVVSNNWAGTADLIDPHTFERLDRINVIPDAKKRIAEIHADPTATAFFDLIRELIGEGHNQYVDDGFTSPDGRVVYFSRPSFADVVAIDLKTEKIVWRTKVGGYRADHMAISDDGRRLLVSASTANVVDVIRTRTGKIIGQFPSGDSPHENNFSARRQADLPREHRHGLHADRRPVDGRHQGRPRLRDRRRPDPEGPEVDRHGPEARGGRLSRT